jgi:hypothetical protein
MMRVVLAALTALVAAAAAPTVTQAQARADSLPRRALSFDRWLTEPTAIVLTAAQQRQVDSIRADYKRDLAKTRAEGRTMDFKESVGAMARLDGRYQNMLRQLLTPEQIKVLNANTKTHGGH